MSSLDYPVALNQYSVCRVISSSTKLKNGGARTHTNTVLVHTVCTVHKPGKI